MVEEPANNPAPAPAHGSDSASTRCVVLTCAGGSTPADLLGGLSKRGVSSRVATDPAEVMVELTRRRTGILIVVDPIQHPALVDLIEAVTLYYPRTVRWAYHSTHPSGRAQLQPLNGRATSQAVNPQPKQQPPQQIEQPKENRLDSPSPLGRVQAQVPPERVRSLIVKVQGPTEVGEPLISEEELAMLLGPVPEGPDEVGAPGEPGELETPGAPGAPGVSGEQGGVL